MQRKRPLWAEEKCEKCGGHIRMNGQYKECELCGKLEEHFFIKKW